jgi:putative addiction module killer protein
MDGGGFAFKKTSAYKRWRAGLRDAATIVRIRNRLADAEAGNFGDHKHVDGGVWEMRLHFGPGWRIYYCRHGGAHWLLYAGTKDTQPADVERAKKIKKEVEDGRERG